MSKDTAPAIAGGTYGSNNSFPSGIVIASHLTLLIIAKINDWIINSLCHPDPVSLIFLVYLYHSAQRTFL